MSSRFVIGHTVVSDVPLQHLHLMHLVYSSGHLPCKFGNTVGTLFTSNLYTQNCESLQFDNGTALLYSILSPSVVSHTPLCTFPSSLQPVIVPGQS